MASVEHTFPQADRLAGAAGREISDLARLRLVTGLILILVSLVGLLGLDWDIQWHSLIGRDRTFTPPHDLMLLGIGLSGIMALIEILIETNWERRHPASPGYSAEFLGVLHGSLGSYLVGFGAVCSAVAFPLDVYWHSLYGIDISLWAPFHTMIVMGGVLGTFGAITLLLSAAHLAQMQQKRRMTRFSYASLVVFLGLLLSQLSTFLTPAYTNDVLRLGSLTLDFFPVLLAFVAVFICVLASKLVPWTGAATMVVAVSLLIFLLVSAFVPPVMTLLVQAEHETYLASASRVGSTIESLKGQTPALLLLALSLDGVVWLARRAKWALARQTTWSLVAAIISMLLVSVVVLVQLAAFARATSGGGTGGSIGGNHWLAFGLALLLTIPGSPLGNWLASTLSEPMQVLRR